MEWKPAIYATRDHINFQSEKIYYMLEIEHFETMSKTLKVVLIFPFEEVLDKYLLILMLMQKKYKL